MESFYVELAELLEVDVVDPARELEGYENWDSLTLLSLSIMLQANFGVTMGSKEIRDSKTAAKLFEFVQSKANLAK